MLPGTAGKKKKREKPLSEERVNGKRPGDEGGKQGPKALQRKPAKPPGGESDQKKKKKKKKTHSREKGELL